MTKKNQNNTRNKTGNRQPSDISESINNIKGITDSQISNTHPAPTTKPSSGGKQGKK